MALGAFTVCYMVIARALSLVFFSYATHLHLQKALHDTFILQFYSTWLFVATPVKVIEKLFKELFFQLCFECN